MVDFLISSPEMMERAIREAGIIPFFRSGIPGYSIQELTRPGFWFDGDEDPLGPWDWKIHCIQCGDIAYGKFLCGGKAAFATIPFYRELMNVRQAAYSPDESGRRILERLAVQGSISSREVRMLLGVKKSAADAAVAKLQHQCRLVTGDIERVYKGPELTYQGWQLSSYCTPEDLFEDSLVTDHTPEESLKILTDHISGLFDGSVPTARILKILR